MTNEKKKRPINRLQSMYPIRNLIDESYKKSDEASKAGKPTAWCMANWWLADPILKAMDVEAVYPENYGGVCAADGVAASYLERSDAEGFPTHMCGYARNCLGYAARMRDLGGVPPEAPMGGMPKPVVLIGRGILCDAGYKWFQAMARYMDTPLWVTEIPHPGVKEHFIEGAYEHDINFMVEGLRKFVTFMEDLLGNKLDYDKLGEVIDNMIEANRIWYEVNELRKVRPCPMHSRDFFSSFPASLFNLGDPKVLKDLFQKMYDEVKYRVDNKISALPIEEKYRVLFAELPPWHSLAFFDRLAERGWNFVIESWGYHPGKPRDLSKVSDPVERVARFSYQAFTSFYENAFKSKEWWGYFAYPELEYAKEYQCDGAFLHPLLTCRTASAHLTYVQDRLMKTLKVPSLVVEGDIVDLKLFDPVDALRRAEIFEETMDHYKTVRKKEGLG